MKLKVIKPFCKTVFSICLEEVKMKLHNNIKMTMMQTQIQIKQNNRSCEIQSLIVMNFTLC